MEKAFGRYTGSSKKDLVTKKRNNYCLVIAIDEYKNSISNLNNCVKDAKEVVNLLTSEYQFEKKLSKVLFNENATRKNILSELRSLKKRMGKEDNLLIMFSGHGVSIDDVGYLLPVDAVDGEDDTFISSGDFLDRLNALSCHHLFFIIDACYSGEIFTNTRSVSKVKANEHKPSRYGFSASHSKEVAYDGKEGENSPFAKYLINKLKSTRFPISLADLATYVTRKVQEETNGKQNPIFRPLNVKGDELGEYVLHPRFLYFKIERVLALARNKNFEDALIELQNYCIESEKLPTGFEDRVCILKNKFEVAKEVEKSKYFIYHREVIDKDIEFECNELIRNIEENKYPRDLRILSMLELISKNDTEKAFFQLIKYVENKDVCLLIKAKLYAYRFAMINRMWKGGELSVYDYYKIYTKYVHLLVLFVNRVERNNYIDAIDFSLELISKNKNIEAMLVLEDFISNNFGFCEEFFLLKMIVARNDDFRNSVIVGNRRRGAMEVEINRIMNGCVYLIKRIREKRTFFEPKKSGETIKCREKIESALLQKGLAEAMNYLSEEISATEIKHFREAFRKLIFIEELEDVLISENMLVNKLLHFLSDLTEVKEDNDNSSYSNHKDEKNFSKMIGFSKKLVGQGEITRAISSLKNLPMKSELKQKIQELYIMQIHNEEDMIFTRKSYELLLSRQNVIIRKVINLIRDINNDVTEEE